MINLFCVKLSFTDITISNQKIEIHIFYLSLQHIITMYINILTFNLFLTFYKIMLKIPRHVKFQIPDTL